MATTFLVICVGGIFTVIVVVMAVRMMIDCKKEPMPTLAYLVFRGSDADKLISSLIGCAQRLTCDR
jgi:hypothetical protein